MSEDEHRVGRDLKAPRDFVFVQIPLAELKHIFGGETPKAGDYTVCGQKILGNFRYAQAARAMQGPYCRECERIWSQS